MCSREWKEKLQEKASSLVTIYTKPVYVFKELFNFLEHNRVVLPGYSFIQEEVVGKAITGERKRLEQAVVDGIPEEQRVHLDNLLTAEEGLHQLTLLKHEPKDFSYQEIQREIDRRETLYELYHLATHFLPSLHISNENIKYYASLVGYYTIQKFKQLNREVEHAYLLCFISYRYQKVNDNLINTFLYHVSKFIDVAKKAAKEQMAEEKLEGNRNLKNAGKILGLFTDETIPEETIFGTIKERAFAILTKEQFAIVSRYMTNATLDDLAYEWEQYVRLSQKFKLNLRHLFLSITFGKPNKRRSLTPGSDIFERNFCQKKKPERIQSNSLPASIYSP
jgi:hypothetical protein